MTADIPGANASASAAMVATGMGVKVGPGVGLGVEVAAGSGVGEPGPAAAPNRGVVSPAVVAGVHRQRSIAEGGAAASVGEPGQRSNAIATIRRRTSASATLAIGR